MRLRPLVNTNHQENLLVRISSAITNTVNYYDKLAHKYDKQYQAYLKHTHGKLLKKIKLSPNDEVLDCSAGTGLLVQELLKKYGSFRRLVLNDPSTKMLERAKYRLRYHDDVEFYGQISEEMQFKDQAFTQIICLNSFHYYTNHNDVLDHFHRMLKPEGNLWLLDWNRTGTFKITSRFIDWLSPENINSCTLDEMRSMLKEAGFVIKEEDTWGYRWWNFFFVRCSPV